MKHSWAFGIAALLLLTAAVAFALDLLVPGASTPAQVVSVRKYAMMTNGANVADLRAKVGSAAVKAGAVNGRSLAITGSVLPTLFAETHSSVYPVQGSRFFFKGGAAADFQAAAKNFVGAAEEVAAAADKEDKPGVDAAVTRLQGTCGACHGTFRGQN